MIIEPKTFVLAVSAGCSVVSILSYGSEIVTISSAQQVRATQQLNLLIEAALSRDSSRKQYFAQSQAMLENGIASATLMDPKLKIGVGGLPVDSFRFDEDPMTNLSIGLMQQFERGDSRKLNQQKSTQQAEGLTAQIQLREREIANQMTQLWLELGYQQQAERLIEENQRLMDAMVSYIQTDYSIGNSEAQDLLAAQLQVNILEDKRLANRQTQDRLIAQLSEWLGNDWVHDAQSIQASNQLTWHHLERVLRESKADNLFFNHLNQHPMALMADINISVNQTQVEIAQQAYTPQFGIEVMYGYRQANNMRGEPASDLLSAYLTMDIPLFTTNRQDRSLSAAQYNVGAAKYQKDALLAQLHAQVNKLIADRTALAERIERYQSSLLPQTNARIEAVERGYQNNEAQFNDLITASTDKLALQLELQRLQTDWNLTNSQLAALLNGFEYQVIPLHNNN
ncbi:TolC family protein [Thaumasiovibrio sp. DFM-14]|uniref:TolC family protein n=1 Tax=Thaumasiovibrio sp. DFM-14 TaxID=3384792 RepID=UPI0039A30913